MNNPPDIGYIIASHSLLPQLLLISSDTNDNIVSPLTLDLQSKYYLTRIAVPDNIQVLYNHMCASTSSGNKHLPTPPPSACTIYHVEEIPWLHAWTKWAQEKNTAQQNNQEFHKKPPQPPYLSVQNQVTRDLARAIECIVLQKQIEMKIKKNIIADCIDTMKLVHEVTQKNHKAL